MKVIAVRHYFFFDFLLKGKLEEIKVSMYGVLGHTVLHGIYQRCAFMLGSKTCLLCTPSRLRGSSFMNRIESLGGIFIGCSRRI